MKYFITMLAITTALATTAPAFAGTDNQADCEAAGGVWSAETNTCSQ